MKTRNAILALRVLCCVPFTAFSTGQCAEKRERPNFLFIIVDDQSPLDLKVYAPESTLETCRLDRLATNGKMHAEFRRRCE